MTAQMTADSASPRGVQRLDPLRHLGQIADVLEVSFAREMGDENARQATREMRRHSRLGWQLRLLLWFGLDDYLPTQGSVWIEDGRVVGTVQTQPARQYPGAWLIANVAVLPEYRRRGIAEALTLATLEHIARRQGRLALLQVDDDNVAAQGLYTKLGFEHVGTHTHWYRAGLAQAPTFEPSGFDIRLRDPREWAADYDLVHVSRPEGLVWDQALTPAAFRSGVLRDLAQAINGEGRERWVASTSTDRLVGSLRIDTGLPEGDRLTLAVHPAFRGQIERALLIRGLRRLGPRPWAIHIEHPADDATMGGLLVEHGFTRTRVLRWMRHTLTP
jgi:ribosomal protein S18 acetylase RimI-like enzyme